LLNVALVIGLGLLFPLVHIANGWLFSFAAVSPDVGLIYLPAFLRLLNVLVLGKFKGTVAGLLGGLILLAVQDRHPLPLELVNMVCSSAGPLVAVLLFEFWRQRRVNLLSLADLGLVTLIYCLANAISHHFAWALMAPHMLGSPTQVLWMVTGDLIGALIGAYLLKWTAERLNIASMR
jgi:hypothetical protein